jgi:hypothetical protein
MIQGRMISVQAGPADRHIDPCSRKKIKQKGQTGRNIRR